MTFFRVLRDRPDDLIRAIRLTPYSREEYALSHAPSDDELEIARRVYIRCWQGFGSKGLVFSIAGRDHVFNAFDIILLVATLASFFLVAISLLAFKKRRDNRIFILTIAFFFFALVQVLDIFENFFPSEYIFITNAERVLNLLILLSFGMLVYGRYKPRK